MYGDSHAFGADYVLLLDNEVVILLHTDRTEGDSTSLLLGNDIAEFCGSAISLCSS